MCIDKESPLYFGAEKCNSFTAELQANVMARLWLLRSGIPDHLSIIFLFDNQSAADAVVGKSVSRTNSTMRKVGIAIDRLCNKIYHTGTHHIHSHDNHPWNELADSICIFVCKKPQESKVRWTPISPIDEKKGFCLDLASCIHDDFVAKSSRKMRRWIYRARLPFAPSTWQKRLTHTVRMSTQRRLLLARPFLLESSSTMYKP